MNYDAETVKQAIKAFTYNERGIFEMPNPVQVATVAAVLETEDKPAVDCIEDAVLLIARAKEVMIRIRADASGPEMKWLTISVQDAMDETGLSLRTLQRYADKLGFKIEGGEMPKQYVARIKEMHRESQREKGQKGFAKSHFKAKKRKART